MIRTYISGFGFVLILLNVSCSNLQPKDIEAFVLPVLYEHEMMLFNTSLEQLESIACDAVSYPLHSLDKIACYDLGSNTKKVRMYSEGDGQYVENDTVLHVDFYRNIDLSKCKYYGSFLSMVNKPEPLDTIIELKPRLNLFIQDTIWGYTLNGQSIWVDTVLGKSLFIKNVKDDYPTYFLEADDIEKEELIEDVILFKFTFKTFLPWIVYNLQHKSGAISDEDVGCYLILRGR